MRRLVVLALCAGIASCASGSAQQPPTSPSANWSLAFQLSGGFAGFDRHLELTSAGAATATDRRRNTTRRSQVPAEELKTIQSLVTAARSADVRAPGCADCFEYNLEVQSGSSRVTIRANDAGMPAGDPAPLIQALRQLLDRVLAEG